MTNAVSKFYNKEIKINKKIKYEKLYRNDHKYDYFILIKYNYNKPIKNKGSAIFIHLTKNYKSTACLLYTSPSPRDQRGARMPGCG